MQFVAVKPVQWLCLALVGLSLGGCATAPNNAAVMRTGDPITDGNGMIATGPAKDRVLWECRTAASAMRRAQFPEAKRLLDDALLTMGANLVNDKSAKKARSLFS